nr:putative metal-binding protein [Raoultella sp. NCTC 9187]
MQSIHGHEVLQMMIASGEPYSVASLEAAIVARFGDEARFHTCSAENLNRWGAGDISTEERQVYCRRRRV